MAAKKMNKEVKKFMVHTPVKNYCGVGAGGVQFAYGKAEVAEGWVLDWYKERGYTIKEIIDTQKPNSNSKSDTPESNGQVDITETENTIVE